MLIKIMIFQRGSFNNIKFALRNCYQLLWVAKISYIKYNGCQLYCCTTLPEPEMCFVTVGDPL